MCTYFDKNNPLSMKQFSLFLQVGTTDVQQLAEIAFVDVKLEIKFELKL